MDPSANNSGHQRIDLDSRLRAPRAAAVAGIIFSALLIISLLLLRHSVPVLPIEASAWLRESSGTVSLSVNLVPFAGIAFLWFIGVLRDRLGKREDRFFATVFMGSGLLFLATLFVAAAFVGGNRDRVWHRNRPTFRFSDIHGRASGCLRNHECLRGPYGGSIHHCHLHACSSHRLCFALDRNNRICFRRRIVLCRAARRLDRASFPVLGSAFQPAHPSGQFWRISPGEHE